MDTEREAPDSHSDYSYAEPETHLRDHWYLLLKRRWLILTVALLGVAAAVVRSLMQTPLYTTTAVVQIHRGRISVVGDVVSRDTWVGYSEFYPTQQRVLMSRTLAYRVVDALELWNHPYFNPAGTPRALTPEIREGLAATVGGMLQVSQERNTQLMNVTFVGPDPDLVALLSNELVRQYISFASETETGVARDTATFIREQIEKLQKEIQSKEKELHELTARQDVVMVDQKENIVIQQLEELNRQLTEAQAGRASAEARFRSLETASPDSVAEVRSNPSVQNLTQQLAGLQKQYAEDGAKFKAEWPAMERLVRAIEDMKRRLEREARTVAAQVVGAARVDYQASLRRESLLKAALEKQKQEAQGLNSVVADYNRVKAELDNQQSLLQQLLKRHSETGLSADLGERQPVNARVVEEALAPKAPFKPNRTRDVLFGTILSLALAVGLAYFLDYWDTSLYTVEDLKRHVRLPYLGMIPRNGGRTRLRQELRRGEAFASNLNHALKLLPGGVSEMGRRALGPGGTTYLPEPRDATDPHGDSILAERFKFLRGSLLLSTPGGAPKTVLVTSPDKHAGKTFVSCNLAISLAELGKKVLVVDADLRNPHVHRAFDIRNKVGLSNVLTGQRDVTQGCVSSTHVPNVFVLLAGPPSPSSAELLASDTMTETLARCASHFDFVLLDSAPLLPVFDTHSLTSRVQAVLLVVRSGDTSRYAVKTSVELVERVGGKVTGVVLNDVDLSDIAQNYYYSHHTYEYGTYPREQAARVSAG